MTASRARGNEKKNASPCVSISLPPAAPNVSRTILRWSPRQRAERLVAELLQELRRPLDVRERERDRAGVKTRSWRNRTRLGADPNVPLGRCACPVCNQENPPGARFCLACGVALEPEAPPQEERRIVSIIFVDLVGSTAQAEVLDPEDVRALLTPYHQLVRREIESFGGVVEKFIGDAIMGVFGAPVAYGDDAERAVRAAFVVRDSVCGMPGSNLQIRIAVNTGEAVVALNARPAFGESMVGLQRLRVDAVDGWPHDEESQEERAGRR